MQGWKRSGALVLSLTILGLSMLQASGMGCSNVHEPVSGNGPAATPPTAPTTSAPQPTDAKPDAKQAGAPAKSAPTEPTAIAPDEGFMMGASKAPVFVRPKPTTSASKTPGPAQQNPAN
jgi:hypothetical protein